MGVNIQHDRIIKVAITGPECSGKTDLAQFLASHYQTQWVPEFAREYLNRLNRPYEQSDLVDIAHGQLQLEDQMTASANRLLICDTDMVVIKVWSEVKYGTADPFVEATIREHRYDLHLLTYIDVPWEEDPQREHPQYREGLYARYQAALRHLNIPYVDIRGVREERRATAIRAIDAFMR